MKTRKLICLLLISIMLLNVFCVYAEKANSEEEIAATSVETGVSSAETDSIDETVRKVKNLVIGTTTANSTFNLLTQADIFGRINYIGFVRANWIYQAADGSLQPYFFTSFDISEDGCILDFTWPTTAVWGDGEPVTWDDIAFTFDFLKETTKSTYFLNLVSVESTGEDSGRITFSEPDVYGWLIGSATMQGVIPKHIWEKFEGSDAYKEYNEDDAAIGCGPYKLVSKDVDAQISYYEAIPENNYHGDITVESVTIKTYADQTAVMAALNAGEIDCYYAYSTPIDYTLMEMITDPSVDKGESLYAGCNQITFGMTRKAGSDYNFRLAVTKAMDWTLLSKTIGGDDAEIPRAGIIPPVCTGYVEDLPVFAQDIDEAKRILDEAGYVDNNGDGFREFPDGSEMRILVVPQYSKSMDLRNRIAEVLVDNLQSVGVNAYVDQSIIVNSEVWESNILEGNYDIAIGYTTAGMAKHTSAFRYYVYEPKPGTERSDSWLWGTYTDPTFNKTVWRMLGASSNDEYLECIQYLQNEAANTLFGTALSWTSCFYPYRTDKYENWYNYPSWGVVNEELWYTLTTK